jgi:hypothetical protein
MCYQIIIQTGRRVQAPVAFSLLRCCVLINSFLHSFIASAHSFAKSLSYSSNPPHGIKLFTHGPLYHSTSKTIHSHKQTSLKHTKEMGAVISCVHLFYLFHITSLIIPDRRHLPSYRLRAHHHRAIAAIFFAIIDGTFALFDIIIGCLTCRGGGVVVEVGRRGGRDGGAVELHLLFRELEEEEGIRGGDTVDVGVI